MMFMSAAVDVKFHFWPKAQPDVLFKPQALSKCTCASWSKDNAYLAYLTEETRPEIFLVRNLKNVKLVHTIVAVDDVTCVCFQRATRRCIAMGGRNGQVLLYDTRTKKIEKLFGNVTSPVRYLDFSVGDQHLSVACQNGNVVVYDVADGHVCGNYVISDCAEPTSLRFHPHQPHILAGSSQEGAIVMWDTTTANKTFFGQIHTSAVSGIAFGKENNDILVTVGDDCKFCVHDLGIRECIFRSSVQQPLSAVDVSPDGKNIVIGAQDGSIYLYDVRNFLLPQASWKAHPTRVTKIAFQNFRRNDQLDEAAPSESVTKSLTTADTTKITSRIMDDDLSRFSSLTKRTMTEKRELDNEFLRNMRVEILSAIQKDAQDASNQLKIHMNNLQSFVQHEFHKMEEQSETMNMTSLKFFKQNHEETSYAPSIITSRTGEHPMILD